MPWAPYTSLRGAAWFGKVQPDCGVMITGSGSR